MKKLVALAGYLGFAVGYAIGAIGGFLTYWLITVPRGFRDDDF